MTFKLKLKVYSLITFCSISNQLRWCKKKKFLEHASFMWRHNKMFNGQISSHRSTTGPSRTPTCKKKARCCVCHTLPYRSYLRGCDEDTERTDTHLHSHTRIHRWQGMCGVLLCPAIHCQQIFYLAAAAGSSSPWIMQQWAPVTSSRPTLHLVCGLKYR